MFKDAERMLKKAENTFPDSNREVVFKFSEFRCKSKLTSQILKGELAIQYIPFKDYLEQVSLWEFINSLEDELILQEDVPVVLLKELVKYIKPRYMKISIEYSFPEGMSMSSVISDEYKM